VSGSVTAAGRVWQFRAPTVQPPNGLYRLATTVGNAESVGGWIYVNGQVSGRSATAVRLRRSTRCRAR
jgi:predicted small integral membrane protein